MKFIASNSARIINKREDLFEACNLIGDRTQEILLPYVKDTEKIMQKIVKKYDRCGEVQIFPSLDLGIPNNKIRLAGGFATGMMISWECEKKLAFVDTTMNVCSSGYFEINNVDDIEHFFNDEKIMFILQEAKEKGFDFCLTSGNHFLMLCKSRHKDKYYLITHFSDMKAKDAEDGLYPNDKVWYSDAINTCFDDNGRYIRYLIDEYADKFYDKAKELRYRNEKMHQWVAKKMCGDNLVCGHIYHHYGMPRDNMILIGSFLAKEKDILPIFTNVSCPVYLFKPIETMWHMSIEDTAYYLIPHGWGQSIVNLSRGKRVPYFEIKNEHISLVGEKNNYSFELKDSYHFPSGFSRVRSFNGEEEFLKKTCHYLEGELVDVLEQKAIYSKNNEKVKYYV